MAYGRICFISQDRKLLRTHNIVKCAIGAVEKLGQYIIRNMPAFMLQDESVDGFKTWMGEFESVSKYKGISDGVSEFNDEPFNFRHVSVVDGDYNYYQRWFSDYIYIWNGCDDGIDATDYYNRDFVIRPHELTVLYFGKPIDSLVGD